MAMARTYASAGAFRKALEERLKSESRARQMDVNRLRRQVSFDRLLARLFRTEAVPWVLKGGYALELRFKAARSTIDIDLTLQHVVGALDNHSAARAVREMLAGRRRCFPRRLVRIHDRTTDLGFDRSALRRRALFNRNANGREDFRQVSSRRWNWRRGDTTSRNYRVFRLAELCRNTTAEGARDLMRAAIR